MKLDSLGVRYRSKWAFRHLDLDLPYPFSIALVGPNGAGKSSLLRVCAGLQRPDEGRVDVNVHGGAPASGTEPASVGYVSQQVVLPGNFTVDDYVRYNAWLQAVPKESVNGLAERAIKEVDLTQQSRTKLRRLSGGMQRRVQLAAAVVHRPRLLLLDEPTVGLDPDQRRTFATLMNRIRGETSVLLSTHILEDAEQICDSVVLIQDGTLQFTGTVRQLSELGEGNLLEGYQAVMRKPTK